MRCRRVDFPEPDGPVIATHSPRATVRFVPSSARTPPPAIPFETSNFRSLAASATPSLFAPEGCEGLEVAGARSRVDGGEQADRARGVQRCARSCLR